MYSNTPVSELDGSQIRSQITVVRMTIGVATLFKQTTRKMNAEKRMADLEAELHRIEVIEPNKIRAQHDERHKIVKNQDQACASGKYFELGQIPKQSLKKTSLETRKSALLLQRRTPAQPKWSKSRSDRERKRRNRVFKGKKPPKPKARGTDGSLLCFKHSPI